MSGDTAGCTDLEKGGTTGGEKPGMLLDNLQHTGQPPTTKTIQAQM